MWHIINTFRLVYPIVIIFVIIFANILGIKLIEIAIEGGWQIEAIKLKLENNTELARLVSALLVLFFSYIIATRDYSSLIPQELRIKMYFDPEKTQVWLDKLPKHLRDDYPMASNIDTRLEQFWSNVSKTVEATSKGEAHFTPSDISKMSGDGKVKIIMSEAEGFQEYYIKSARGVMELSYPDLAVPLDTIFEIAKHSVRHISVPIPSLIRARGFYIQPTFTQLYKQPYGPAIPFKDLVVLTFISAGTRIRITHSIYLFKDEESNKYLPIGIGIYHSG